jgi:two-component system NtrC family sensor kinase
VASLRWLSRPTRESHGTVELAQVLETSAAIAANEIRHRARFEKNLGDLPVVQGDPARLGQVFVNLLVNAAQSIAPGATESNHIRLDAFVRGPNVVVEVRDTGAGIAAELQAKVFEPFFTTKDPSSGTGLGLAISRNIVQEHGGQIELESVPGQGSLFRVLLPVGRPLAPLADPPARISERAAPRTRVLVIDDDPQVLSALSRMLKDEYQVLAMRSARAALDHLVAERDFGVILCDLMMPEVTGMDFYAQVERLYPALGQRVVFMTGGAFAPEARDFLRRVSRLCLDKPFTRGELQAALTATVNASAARAD